MAQSAGAASVAGGHRIVGEIKQRARGLGFDLCGIAPADARVRGAYLREWLAAGRHGEMEYLAERVDERADLERYFPGVRSVICVAINYKTPDPPSAPPDAPDDARNDASDHAPPGPHRAHGKIARYALGEDYHLHLKQRLYALADWLREAWPGTRTRCGTDSVPVMEKDLAARAGVGWMGKNTCIIHPQIGSWLLLGEVLTTLDLPPDEPMKDRCGTCTRCIDACPTAAITGPYQLDARRCISYLTIERRSDLPDDLKAAVGDWAFGCDICQEVCPWNGDAPWQTDPAFTSRFAHNGLDVAEVLAADDDALRGLVRRTALKRIKLPQLRRNAAIVQENLTRAAEAARAAEIDRAAETHRATETGRMAETEQTAEAQRAAASQRAAAGDRTANGLDQVASAAPASRDATAIRDAPAIHDSPTDHDAPAGAGRRDDPGQHEAG